MATASKRARLRASKNGNCFSMPINARALNKGED